MNRRALLFLGTCLTAVMLLAACAGGAQIRNVDGAMLDRSHTPENVERAIIRAGSSLGWRMQPQAGGHVLGTLEVRDHMAQVDIRYDEDSFDIHYRDSQNLNHDPEEGTIHPNYNGWIQNLERSIHNELAAM